MVTVWYFSVSAALVQAQPQPPVAEHTPQVRQLSVRSESESSHFTIIYCLQSRKNIRMTARKSPIWRFFHDDTEEETKAQVRDQRWHCSGCPWILLLKARSFQITISSSALNIKIKRRTVKSVSVSLLRSSWLSRRPQQMLIDCFQ